MRDRMNGAEPHDGRLALRRIGHVVTRFLVDDAPLDGKSLLCVGRPDESVLDVLNRLALDVHCVCDTDGLSPFPFHTGTFDFAYADSVLETAAASNSLLRETSRVLRFGGRAVVIAQAEPRESHVRTFTRRALRDALVIHGFDGVTCYRFAAGQSALAASLSKWFASLPDWLNDVVPAADWAASDDACLIAAGRKSSSTRVETTGPPRALLLDDASHLTLLGTPY